jgi:hypothetical protein
LTLFQAFDRPEPLAGDSAEVIVSPADVEEHTSTLDL